MEKYCTLHTLNFRALTYPTYPDQKLVHIPSHTRKKKHCTPVVLLIDCSCLVDCSCFYVEVVDLQKKSLLFCLFFAFRVHGTLDVEQRGTKTKLLWARPCLRKLSRQGFGGLWGWVIYVFLCCLDGSRAPLDQISPSQYPPDTPHIAGFPQDSVRFMLKISFSSEIRPGSHTSGVDARGCAFNLFLTYLRTLWARKGFI